MNALFTMRNGRKGFTLIEVMISFFILALVFAGVITGIGRGTEMYVNAAQHTTATEISQELLHNYRETGFDNLTSGTTFGAVDDFDAYPPDFYYALTTITQDATRPDMLTISVRVVWADNDYGTGVPMTQSNVENNIAQMESITLETHVTKGGFNGANF